MPFYYVLSFLQVYSLEGEAIQVHGVWQRILSIANAGRAQNSAFGRVPAQVPSVQSEF